MARVKMNPIFEQMSGSLGDLVLKRYGDEVVVARKPTPNGHEPSARQLAVRERFRRAAQYGKMALAQPEVRTRYAAAAKERQVPVFALTVADYFAAPVVDEVSLSGYTGRTGQTIVLQAHDDFEVTGVTVQITTAGGQLVETGPAVQDPPNSSRWTYVTTQTLSDVTGAQVTATASDRPGNEGTRTVVR